MIENSVNTVEKELEQLQEIAPAESVHASRRAEPTESPAASLKPIDVAWILWSRRHWIARVCVTGLFLFTIIAFTIPKRYTATTRLMPPDYGRGSLASLALGAMGGGSEGSGGGGGSSVMGLASQVLGMNSSGDLYVGVLGSRTVQDGIIDRFGLMQLYSVRYIEDARKKLDAVTDIQIDKKAGTIAITVEDKSPQRAAAMAQAYVELLNSTLAEVNTSSAHRERIFVETRLRQVKQELDDSAKEFSAFASQNAAIDVPEQAKAMVTAAANLQAELIVAESDLKSVQQIFTDNSIQVRQVKARIAALQDQIDKFGGKDVDVTKDTALAKGELYPSLRQLPLVGVKYLDLYRRTKIDEAVYELLTKQYEIAKIQEAREIPSAQVLDVALIPTKKSSPHRGSIAIAGLLLSFLFASTRILVPIYWSAVDSQSPTKLFAETVLESVNRRTWGSPLARKARAIVWSHRDPKLTNSPDDRKA